MTDATTEFFEELAARGHEPALAKATGTLRIDLRDGGARAERWLITITKGDVAVSHRNAKADCVIRVDRTLFDRIASGETNAMAAFLRGAMESKAIAASCSRSSVRFQDRQGRAHEH